MNSLKFIRFIFYLFVFLVCSSPLKAQLFEEFPQTWNYAVEIDGILCGYSESTLSEQNVDGLPLWILDDDILVKMAALGGGVDMTIKNHYEIQAETTDLLSVEHSIATSAELYAFSKFEDGKVYHTSIKGRELEEIELPEDVIIENSLTYPHLMKDFILGNEEEKSYAVYDDMRGNVATKIYRRVGAETIELAGKTYETIILDEANQSIGVTTRTWFDKTTSFPLKINISNRVIYLADKSVKKKIQVVNMDNVLFARVGEIIPNVQDIAYLNVEAKIESGGETIDVAQLNFPGQVFVGTVVDNFIDGVFEIEPVRYQGENALPFPPNIQNEALIKYLEAEPLIESDDPILMDEAKNITKGARDSWEASIMLSKWVAENIRGAVPGGTSAINTYNTREGECGSHSRLLAAFCRAVGIPSRLSVGCMYSPYLGGSFGQHAWTEVYMGDAGWIAIDATAFEYDYIDAGHIRLGEKASFNPREMKILEYRMKGGDDQLVENSNPFESYIGKYKLAEANRIFEVIYQAGNLAVDIPGQTVLSLNDPDESGIFYPKMTRQVNFSFIKDDVGIPKTMKLQQLVALQKKEAAPEKEMKKAPEALKDLIGNYQLSQPQATFRVFVEDGRLMVNDPLSKSVITLYKQENSQRWIDEFERNEILFDRNPAGVVTGMTIFINVYLDKI